ncbi:hypothetical protein Hanom_Chr04g00305661 [Helianthus anomalus]
MIQFNRFTLIYLHPHMIPKVVLQVLVVFDGDVHKRNVRIIRQHGTFVTKVKGG